MLAELLPLIPDHRLYCEVFGGSAALLLAKLPVAVEVYNDLDSGLVNFWSVVADPSKFEQLQLRLALTPYSEELFQQWRHGWADGEDDVEQARRWFLVARASFAGRFSRGGYSWRISQHRTQSTAGRYLSAVDRLTDVHERLRGVQVDHADWSVMLNRYDHPDTLFYLDPPYVQSTRSGYIEGDRYRHEMTDDDHIRLVDRLLVAEAKVMLSGYDNDIYRLLDEAGWSRHTFTTHIAAKQTDKPERTEAVWLSPNCNSVQGRLDLTKW